MCRGGGGEVNLILSEFDLAPVTQKLHDPDRGV